MRKNILGIALTLIILNVFTLAFNMQSVRSETSTIIVPDDYPTIQEAIDAAKSVWGIPSSGHTIFVRAGTYYENIAINMSNHYLTIIGENALTTIIDGADASQAVVTIKDVLVQNFANFTVKNSGGNAPGIYVYNSTGRISRNNIMNNFQGVNVHDSFEVEITNNNFLGNTVGINVSYAMPIPRGNNFIYHNYFVDNIQQAIVSGYPFLSDLWDDGYPSGGNYWSDYTGADVYSGSNQDESGSDGIGDIPYVIDADNQDRYPLWTSSTQPVTATVNIDPDTLNLKSRGEWITAYVELPEDYNVSNIDVFTVMLNNTISAEMHPVSIGDEDGDGTPDLMVKFSRAETINYITTHVLLDWKFASVTLSVTGNLNDGTRFEGSDTIKIVWKPPIQP